MADRNPWRPISSVPPRGMVIVRGADGKEYRWSGGWTDRPMTDSPLMWRYMVEELDDYGSDA